MNGPYINEDGDMWYERGSATWPRIRSAASGDAWMVTDGKMEYVGIEKDVRVSDNHEAGGVHGDDDGCADSQGKEFEDPSFEPCCRTIEAYHFRASEL